MRIAVAMIDVFTITLPNLSCTDGLSTGGIPGCSTLDLLGLGVVFLLRGLPAGGVW